MIDWDRVASLRDEIGAMDFAEVVEMFLGEADEVVGRLRVGKPDPTLEAELHALKGSALNLGFAELALLCSSGERQANVGERVDLARVTLSYAESRLEFESGLEERKMLAA